MKKFLALSFLSLAIFACSNDEPAPASTCSTAAKVRDLTGLDGCGFVFELADGSRLEPVIIGWCGTPPLSEEQLADPLNNFEWVDGKEVMIDYEPFSAVSICMVGQSVRITCISEIDPAQTDH
jgi:hypothetical protein